MLGYFGRVSRRWSGWVSDAFVAFVWWRDIPGAVWFALFGPRWAGEDVGPEVYDATRWDSTNSDRPDF